MDLNVKRRIGLDMDWIGFQNNRAQVFNCFLCVEEQEEQKCGKDAIEILLRFACKLI